MPDTAIVRVNGGWVDRDNANVTWPTRWRARDARRARLTGKPVVTQQQSKPTQTITFAQLATSASANTTATTLTSLQFKLFNRLTQSQGVSDADAQHVIENYGYNQAASYGHMRAAGANHFEAVAVIQLQSPEISLEYGKCRAVGSDHTDALACALKSSNAD